jgi:hypothetical protein
MPAHPFLKKKWKGKGKRKKEKESSIAPLDLPEGIERQKTFFYPRKH